MDGIYGGSTKNKNKNKKSHTRDHNQTIVCTPEYSVVVLVVCMYSGRLTIGGSSGFSGAAESSSLVFGAFQGWRG